MWGSLNIWRGCPQSRLYREVRASRDRDAIAVMQLVAGSWDDLGRATSLVDWFPWLHPRTARPRLLGRYGAVTAVVSERALVETLDHIAALRRDRRVRSSLAAVAFLECFEAVIATELDRRATAASRRTGCAEPVAGRVPATSRPAAAVAVLAATAPNR